MTAVTRYSRTAMVLHWLIALLLAFEIGLGQRTEHLKNGPELFRVFQLHKSIGITILLLSLWRLWTRLRHPRPIALVDTGWAKMLSSAVHYLFYAVMILGPLTGWILVSTAKVKIPTVLFGVIPWPDFPFATHAMHEISEVLHGLLANVAILLFVLHIVGALRHQFFIKDNVIARMTPLARAGIIAVVGMIAAVGLALVSGKIIPAPVANISAVTATPVSAKPTVPAAPAPVPVIKDEALIEAETNAPIPLWQVTGGALNFNVGISGERVSGSFKKWDADIRFDPEQLGQSSIRVITDLSSVESGDKDRDSMLAGTDFFAISAHPRAAFTSTTITALGPNRYRAEGSLKMKGVSKPMRLDFTLTINDTKATASGSGTLDRRSYTIGEGQFTDTDTISADVKIDFTLRAKRKV